MRIAVFLVGFLPAACSGRASAPEASAPGAGETAPPSVPDASGTPATDPPPGRPGMSCCADPGAWCPSPAGDPCGAHTDVESCRADPACTGMAYCGESYLPCTHDERGFGTNCPTVGCVSR